MIAIVSMSGVADVDMRIGSGKMSVRVRELAVTLVMLKVKGSGGYCYWWGVWVRWSEWERVVRLEGVRIGSEKVRWTSPKSLILSIKK